MFSCGAQMSLTRCVRGRGSCAHPTPSRGPAVSHCDHLLPQESGLTPTLSRHFCPSTSVSVCVCEGPEAFLLPPHARLAFSHTVRPCCIFVPTQRLLGSPVQSLTAAPHHEPSGGVQPHHERHPSLRSARSPASLPKRVIRVTQERTKPKTVPQKNKPCLLGLTESSSQRNTGPHKPPQPAEEPLDRHHLSFIRHIHPQTGDPPKKRSVGLPL